MPGCIFTYKDKDCTSCGALCVYGSKSWTLKEQDRQSTNAFELWCWKDSGENQGQSHPHPTPPQKRQTNGSSDKLTGNFYSRHLVQIILLQTHYMKTYPSGVSINAGKDGREGKGRIFWYIFLKVPQNLVNAARSGAPRGICLSGLYCWGGHFYPSYMSGLSSKMTQGNPVNSSSLFAYTY